MLNTCSVFISDLVGSSFSYLVYYSHLVPIFLILILAIFLFLKSNFRIAANSFAMFSFFFCFWLIADLVTWKSENYYLIHFFWSLLDYVNLLFVLVFFYLFWVIVHGKDAPNILKIVVFSLSLPAFWATFTGNTVLYFDHTWCESTGVTFIANYKFVISILVIVSVIAVFIWNWFKNKEKRKSLFFVTSGILLFLLTFSITEYVSVITENYRIALYGLLVLPVFIGMLVYSIVKYKYFEARLIASNALIISLILVIAVQFIFLRSNISIILNSIGLVFVLIAGFYLVKSVQQIERQKEQLQKANAQQESLMRFINHQVKGFLTRSRLIFDALKNDEYGKLSPEAKKLVDVGFDTNTQAVQMVKSLLDASNLQDGTVNYQHVNFDFRALVSDILGQLKPTAEAKGLKLNSEIDPTKEMMVNGDLAHLAQAVRNLIENSIQYTSAGAVTVSLSVTNDKKVLFKVSDTGLGLSEEDKKVLFRQGGRGDEAQRRNVNSTGYGLYITYKIVKDHKGQIKASSAGRDKGSTFEFELPLV